ncbi:MAG TPA: tetratricopeptide repeat protein [Sideroxyarcus sp.]|nr:tetratricopeptide repeat protein [Sideroxyarcus sp.]
MVPLAPPVAAEPVAPAAEQQPVMTARNDDFDAPRSKPQADAPRRAKRPATGGVTFQRQVETDTITPALLDAYQAYQRGDYVTAAQGYRQVLGKDAHNRDALLGLAATAQQQGQDESAQRYYRQLLVLDPRDPVAQAALSAYAPGDAGDTESRLKQLLSGQPRSGALHFALGNLYAEQSNWGEAQQSYFNAHTLEPANAQFTFNLAVSLDHLGQRKLAAQYYQQALQLDTAGNSGFDRAQAQQRLNELTPAH